MTSEDDDLQKRKMISLSGLPEIESAKEVIRDFNRYIYYT